MRKIILVIALLCLSFSFISCTESNISTDINNEQDTENESYVEYEIPEVFVVRCCYDGYDVYNSSYNGCAYLLYNKDGNMYRYEKTGNIYVCENPDCVKDQLDEFLSDYYDGKLEGEVRLIESYSDEEGVQRCLTDLQNVINNKEAEMVSGSDITVGTISKYHDEFYGVYYDENHELKTICLYITEEYKSRSLDDKGVPSIINWIRFNRY